MTRLLRLLSRPILPALTVLALGAPAFAETMLPIDVPDSYGSYLAGAQALRDLSGSDAERFMRDAAATQWTVPEVAQRAFIAELINGDIDRATTSAGHVLELTSDYPLATLAIASSDLKGRRYSRVERELAGMSSKDFIGISAGVLRAWAFVGDGRGSDADAVMAKLGKGGLGDFLTFHRALMADISGDSAAATRLIAKAYQLEPNSPRTVEAYARILGNAGRFDDALAAINKFEGQGFGDPSLEVVAKALAANQRPGPYVASAQAGAAELYHAISLALARDGNADLAVGFLQLGLYLDPHNDSIRLLIGQLLDGAGQHADADTYYADVPDGSPLKLTASVRIAQNYDAMGDREEALRQLSNLAAANPTDTSTLTVLADMLRRAKQYDKSAAVYTQAIAIDNGARAADWVLYYGRGIAYERGGHWDKAQPDFLEALTLNPGQPNVLNYLGYTWVDKGQNLDKALGMIQQAVKATPTDGFIVDSLGWAFYKLDRIPEAVSTLERAVQLKPNDPQINDHLGDAYWKAGRRLEAHFQWNVAASLDPDATLKAEIARKQADGLPNGATASTAASATPAAVPATVTQ